MCLDSGRGRVVMFGGDGGFPVPGSLADTWEWDGTAWTLRSSAISPTARSGHAMAYDANRGRTVLYGGNWGTDTWEWDGTAWLQCTPATTQTGRTGCAMGYDTHRQRVVLFGGGGIPNVMFSDACEWDGTAWTGLFTSFTPEPRLNHAMCADPIRGHTVLFGGNAGRTVGTAYANDETWLLGSWSPTAASPVGNACYGSNGYPQLTSGTPHVGNRGFVLDLLATRPLSPCLFGIAAATQSLHLGGGCSLYLRDGTVLLPSSANANGFATVTLAIPMQPALRGWVLYAQGLVLDAGGAFSGLALTNGLHLLVGD
jgi:hypothetical protein